MPDAHASDAVRRSIDVDAPATVVWQLLATFRHWPEWGPTVTAVDVDARVVAPGVEGRVRTPLGLWLPFVITDVEPGRAWAWQVAGLPATGHAIVSTGPSRCRLEFTAPWWGAAYGPVLNIGLRRLQRLAARHREFAAPST